MTQDVLTALSQELNQGLGSSLLLGGIGGGARRCTAVVGHKERKEGDDLHGVDVQLSKVTEGKCVVLLVKLRQGKRFLDTHHPHRLAWLALGNAGRESQGLGVVLATHEFLQLLIQRHRLEHPAQHLRCHQQHGVLGKGARLSLKGDLLHKIAALQRPHLHHLGEDGEGKRLADLDGQRDLAPADAILAHGPPVKVRKVADVVAVQQQLVAHQPHANALAARARLKHPPDVHRLLRDDVVLAFEAKQQPLPAPHHHARHVRQRQIFLLDKLGAIPCEGCDLALENDSQTQRELLPWSCLSCFTQAMRVCTWLPKDLKISGKGCAAPALLQKPTWSEGAKIMDLHKIVGETQEQVELFHRVQLDHRLLGKIFLCISQFNRALGEIGRTGNVIHQQLPFGCANIELRATCIEGFDLKGQRLPVDDLMHTESTVHLCCGSVDTHNREKWLLKGKFFTLAKLCTRRSSTSSRSPPRSSFSCRLTAKAALHNLSTPMTATAQSQGGMGCHWSCLRWWPEARASAPAKTTCLCAPAKRKRLSALLYYTQSSQAPRLESQSTAAAFSSSSTPLAAPKRPCKSMPSR
eukprot:m.164579 g.164579  ORF g.164579 m.164579 type:complete len:579 (+) comp15225_c0_seq3:1364-3100(+)